MPLPSTIPSLAYTVASGGAVFNARTTPNAAGGFEFAQSAGAATLYQVNHPGTQNATRVVRFVGDGATTIFTVPTLPAVNGQAQTFAALPTTVAASLNSSNYLQAIMITYPVVGQVQSASLRVRVGTDVGPTGTQWRVTTSTTITFGTAPAVGTICELIVPDTTLITQATGGAFVANQIYVIRSSDFLAASTAAVQLWSQPES